MTARYIGLMSGTSLDAIDLVMVEFGAPAITWWVKESTPFPADLRQAILAAQSTRTVTLPQIIEWEFRLGECYAKTILDHVSQEDLETVRAVGSHGQTLWHQPPGSDNPFPGSLQIGDPNIIAERTGRPVVADFRRMDMAAGGEGAPLVTAFHQQYLSHNNERRAIVNLGGIANITLLDGQRIVAGFDSGPANSLLDAWIQNTLQEACDVGGNWARQGRVNEVLLEAMLADPYFQRMPPKSTGREYFGLTWLRTCLEGFPEISAEDIQATLLELTAVTIVNSIQTLGFDTDRLILCGGGVNNAYLVQRIRAQAGCPVESSESYGLSPKWLEATAFAWLAMRRVQGQSGNVPDSTGAHHAAILGGLYQPI